jgi:hypothetical protein
MQAAHTEFADFDTLKNALENYDESKAPAAFAELKELLMQWNWKVKNKGEKDVLTMLIAALACASFIQSTFTFRPQVYITGESATGKTQVLKCLKMLFGNLHQWAEQPTEAAVRQVVKTNSNILLIDELERDKQHSYKRERLLKTIRSSTGEGNIIRGTMSQKSAMEFRLQHMVWLASIELDLTDPADASRFFLFETEKAEEQNGKKTFLDLPAQKLQQIGFDLMIFAIKNMNALLESVERLKREDIDNTTHRNLDGVAVPAAFAEALCGWAIEETRCFMSCCIDDYAAQKTIQVIDEHTDLFRNIQTAIIPVDNKRMTTVQIVRQFAGQIAKDHATAQLLEMYGIKILKHQDQDVVFFETGTIKRNLLKGSDWQKGGLSQLLTRVKGAKKIVVRFNGTRMYDFCVPLETFIGDNNDKQQEF